jgi:hypothetical protein
MLYATSKPNIFGHDPYKYTLKISLKKTHCGGYKTHKVLSSNVLQPLYRNINDM